MSSMQSQKAELDYEFLPYLRAYKDGSIVRLLETDTVPPSSCSQTKVTSKDVLIIPDANITARLFLPEVTNMNKKLPLLVYYHGGAFCFSSTFNPIYHNFLNSLVSQANVVVVSVNYRLAPEHPLPIAYQDSLNALKWVASHSKGDGSEAWLNEYVDFDEVFLAGDSAGGNIAHNMAVSVGKDKANLGMEVSGVVLIQPFFWGSKSIGSEASLDIELKCFVDRIWPFVSPTAPDNDDPRINPVGDGGQSLSSLGCKKVLVCVAGKDILRDRGWLYYERLRECGWNGAVEIVETEGEGHVFHLHNPTDQKAKELMKRIVSFLQPEKSPVL